MPEHASFNHHFWGDISALFIEYFGGIRINPDKAGADTAAIAPVFPASLSSAKATHESVVGKIKTEWKRSGDKIELSLSVPEKLSATVKAPDGYFLVGGERRAENGVYTFVKL